MALTKQQLIKAYKVLAQGVVYLDEKLSLGVLVYIEAKAVEFGIARDEYLTLENLQSSFPYVSMGSYMPINFFGNQATDVALPLYHESILKPISLKLCKVIPQEGFCSIHRWTTVASYSEDQIEEAIHALIAVLGNDEHFSQCIQCKNYRPSGYIDDVQTCECCKEQLLVVA
ncbi:hypothetical protein [uncultured Photobacterium sp.]|uniref:hypothetical protein n=1 Tax=uncultured Photobacterium sp. TaxID=173973 RepID=UPI00262775F3|nr:hypothetical protein [uncultured Photobacterium sp.]